MPTGLRTLSLEDEQTPSREGRAEACTVALGGAVYVMGGHYGAAPLRTVERLSDG